MDTRDPLHSVTLQKYIVHITAEKDRFDLRLC